jgi:hypothetical protein
MFKELLDIDSSRFWIYAAARATSAAGLLDCASLHAYRINRHRAGERHRREMRYIAASP